MKTVVFVKLQFAAFHHWPEAPAEVAFLRDLHRHKFFVKVGVEVDHDNRDVEFFILQGHVNLVLKKLMIELRTNKSMSCEMMAKYISVILPQAHKYLIHSVEVSEDDENGAILYL